MDLTALAKALTINILVLTLEDLIVTDTWYKPYTKT